ncbi:MULTISPECIES: histidine phosphatase family protein [unclassified Sphingobacterium]|uniref:histidine phosphatase family protein n=1 Tax=unclassified Sphingobacterium TaxID=2609468 RepID=UPI0029543E7E|nr:histidine phosphatase family protein [Sphingobacterium sp. UGAL515B_05]WON92851.1 histidine phosphatase family protein [Sphingobacterium sp. UGAL515B_05]
MKKTFYFIRHGQTDLNLKGIVQGRGVNSPLNKMGLAQAQAFFDRYNTVPFDKIYTSTLLRTHQTVQGFLDLDLPWEQLVGLDEISWGIYEGKEQTPELLAGFEKLVAAWRNGELDVSIENGESPNALMARQQVALDHMLAQTDEKNILVCMHGRALRIMLCLMTGVDARYMDDFPHTNTALYKLLYDNGQFEIVDHYNTAHLEALINE